jgi:anti-sigma regulatory factor (Ser/Thr protein kinase)
MVKSNEVGVGCDAHRRRPTPPFVPRPVPAFDHRFEPAAECIPETRRALRRWLEQLDTDAEIAYDALLVATELATNGVLHDGGGDVTVHAEFEDRSLLLAVDTVDLPGPPPPSLRAVRDPFESGRGIPLLKGLTDDFGMEIDGQNRHVWCRIRVSD